MKNPSLLVLLLIVVLLGGCTKGSERSPAAPPQNPAEQPKPEPETIACTAQVSFFGALLSLTNAERQKAGLTPLRMALALSQAAQFYAEDMATRNFFSHTSPEGSSVSNRAQRFGYTGLAGENIAAGYKSPEAVIQGWMNSPGHRANVLNSQYTEIGLGFFNRSGSEYGTYWAQVFGIRTIDPADPVVSAVPESFTNSCTLAQNNSDPIVLSSGPDLQRDTAVATASTPEPGGAVAWVVLGGYLAIAYRRCSARL